MGADDEPLKRWATEMSVLDRIASWLDRREIVNLRRDLACLREANRLMEPRIKYLNSRDEMCSSMANTINKQAFEIAKLKGVYAKPGGE